MMCISLRRNALATSHTLLKRLSWLLVLLVFASVASSCAVVDRVQQVRAEHQVPKEMSTLWQVYQTLKADYAGKETLDEHKVAQGAVKGLLAATAETDTSYLPESSYDLDAPNLGGVWTAWRIVSDHLKKAGSKVTAQQEQEGAIRGMLTALGNPYTRYVDPEGYTLEEQDLHSNFEGIGAWVNLLDGQLTIVGLIADSPAGKVGIKEGDVILKADGKSLEGLSVTEAVLLIRGPHGTPVTLSVQSPGDAEPHDVKVVRETVEQPSVVWQPVNDDIAILNISEFMDNTDERVRDALKEIQAKGYKGLVLDLRHNPGGLLDTTVNVASQFLTEGLVLYHIDSKGVRKDFPVRSGGVAPDLPLVVLANGASASGSEVLTGALQDHKRAVFVGTQTYGKGSVNELRKLEDGSGLYITAALWYTPDGRLIEGQGLTPDIEVFNERVIARGPDGQLGVTVADRQLERAVRLLLDEISAKHEAVAATPAP